MQRKIRLIVAKPGLDGHDRGAKVIARGLRDAGFEVIYTGLHQTAEDIVESVIQEDPDALLLSILSGAHSILFPKIMSSLDKEGINDVLVLGGGIIPDEDVPALKECGISEVFGPGSKIQEIADYIHANLKR
jgi:methylmalonyl-CoA mutase C-terminal domain/subunit